MNGYELSRIWFAFAYENKEAKPVHTALYFWIVERANNSGWKKIIDIQTEKSMECLGITDWRTYKNALQFLTNKGFIQWVEKSKNQYTCNRVSLLIKAEKEHNSLSIAYAQNAEPNVEAIAEAYAEALVEAYAEAHAKAIAEALQSYINLKTTKPETPKPEKGVIPISGATAPASSKNDAARGRDDSTPGQQKKEKEKGSAQKEKAPAQIFTDAYCDFYERKVGVKPKFSVADGVAANDLRKYLIQVSKDKTEDSALSGLNFIFENWNKLEPFFQEQVKLTQINSNINNILNQLRNGSSKGKQSNTGITDDDIQAAVRAYSAAGY